MLHSVVGRESTQLPHRFDRVTGKPQVVLKQIRTEVGSVKRVKRTRVCDFDKNNQLRKTKSNLPQVVS